MDQNPYSSPTHHAQPAAKQTRLWAIGLAVASLMFLVSLGTSTIATGTDKTDRGFLLGIVCLLFGQNYVAWWANPFLFFSAVFLFLKRFQLAGGCAAIAVALSLTVFVIQEVMINTAGTMGPVMGYGIGFYLWLGCSLVLLVTSLASLGRNPNRK